MPKEPFGTTIFCDDIRHEVGGKLTLVGCYATEMNFGSPAPSILPILAALTHIRVPVGYKFSHMSVVALKIEENEKNILGQAEIDLDESRRQEMSPKWRKKFPEEETVHIFAIPFKWTPFAMMSEGMIRIIAKFDDKDEIKVGTLLVNFPEEVSGSPQDR